MARPQALRDRQTDLSLLNETLDPDSSDSSNPASTPVQPFPLPPSTTTTWTPALVDDPAPARASTSALSGTPRARLFRTPSPAGERSDNADVKPLAFGEGYGLGLGKKGKSPTKTSGKKRQVVCRMTTTTTTTVVEEEVDDKDKEEVEEWEWSVNRPPSDGKGGSGGGRDSGGVGGDGGGAGTVAAVVGLVEI
ncbi:uncharacterized protein JCM10292_006931 [Rhodotorula paludigena]|uniref:uncharacterized protein n=1 Tax=Rhodotorula paludigena TaxID=86838 RepID=UPI0031718A00